MKKLICYLMLFVLFISLCACSSQSMSSPATSTSTPSQQALPDSEIMFLSIPWGTTQVDAVARVRESYPEINSVEEEKLPVWITGDRYRESVNFSDPTGQYLPSYSTKWVETKCVTLKSISSGKYAFSNPIGPVAGYKVNSIILYFVDIDGEYCLYKAAYSFIEDQALTPLKQFSDIQRKMSSLYGEAKEYSYDESVPLETTNLCSVWIAEDGSAAYLNYTFYLSGSALLDGSEAVSLYYGTTSINELFVNSISEAEKQEREDQQQHIADIESDSSGL